MNNTTAAILGLALGLASGTYIAWKFQKPVVIEKPAPAIILPSGAYVPERKPDADVPKPITQAAKELHSKVVRAGTVHIEDAKPTVDLDWGLVTNDDGKRIVFYTDDGTITGGVDVPVDTLVQTVFPKWSVGVAVPVSYPKGIGPSIERHFGRFSVGIEAFKLDRNESYTALVTTSISW